MAGVGVWPALIYHADLATQADLDIIAKARMPIAPILTSPWIGVEHGGTGRGLCDRVRDRLRSQPDTSFQMIRNAPERRISVMSGSDTATALSHGRWHGKEAELFVKEVGIAYGGNCRQHEPQCLARRLEGEVA